jgi:cysteine-rich repeat protein
MRTNASRLARARLVVLRNVIQCAPCRTFREVQHGQLAVEIDRATCYSWTMRTSVWFGLFAVIAFTLITACSFDGATPIDCGNGKRDPDEACDDGNSIDDDGCSASCTVEAVCGDGTIDADEACDDGNTRDSDDCAANCKTELMWIAGSPGKTSYAAAAYDRSREVIVMFGGSDGFDHAETWESTTVGWKMVVTKHLPLVSNYATMAYDQASKRIVMFGGLGANGILADTWEYDGIDWTLIVDANGPARHDHAMAYDSVKQRLVMFGGFDGANSPSKQTWVYQNQKWSMLLEPAADVIVPPALTGASMAFDGNLGKIVMFGGVASDVYQRQLWQLNDDTWSVATIAKPQPRKRAALGFDESRQQLVLSGGYNGYLINDTWIYKNGTWDQQFPLITSSRFGASSLYVPSSSSSANASKFVVLGGLINNGIFTSTQATWDGSNWAVSDPPPLARTGMAVAYDSVVGTTLMFGGFSSGSVTAETWQYDEQWTKIVSDQIPAARSQSALAYDPKRKLFVMFGGSGSIGYNDTWEFAAGQWTQRIATGLTDSPVGSNPTMVYNPTLGKMVLFSGYGGMNDTWTYQDGVWTKVPTGGAPPSRYYYAMTFDPIRGKVVMFGGVSATVFGDTWEFDGSNWHRIVSLQSPPQRYNSSMQFDAGRGVTTLVGGVNSKIVLSDTWDLDAAGWHRRRPKFDLAPRYSHAMVHDGKRGRMLSLCGTGAECDVTALEMR